MRRSVDISIRKSFERFKDFDNDSRAGKEIMETLSVLHTVRKMLDDFQVENAELFNDKDKLG
jgi:urease gamma subunit